MDTLYESIVRQIIGDAIAASQGGEPKGIRGAGPVAGETGKDDRSVESEDEEEVVWTADGDVTRDTGTGEEDLSCILHMTNWK